MYITLLNVVLSSEHERDIKIFIQQIITSNYISFNISIQQQQQQN